MISNCCSAEDREGFGDMGICPKCREHCEWYEECEDCEDGIIQEYCDACNGTGEGMHADTKCRYCYKSRGVVHHQCDCDEGWRLVE